MQSSFATKKRKLKNTAISQTQKKMCDLVLKKFNTKVESNKEIQSGSFLGNLFLLVLRQTFDSFKLQMVCLLCSVYCIKEYKQIIIYFNDVKIIYKFTTKIIFNIRVVIINNTFPVHEKQNNIKIYILDT